MYQSKPLSYRLWIYDRYCQFIYNTCNFKGMCDIDESTTLRMAKRKLWQLSHYVKVNMSNQEKHLSAHVHILIFSILFYFTDIKTYKYLCTLLCVYILLLLSCFGCSQYIILFSKLYHRHSFITIQFSHIFTNYHVKYWEAAMHHFWVIAQTK